MFQHIFLPYQNIILHLKRTEELIYRNVVLSILFYFIYAFILFYSCAISCVWLIKTDNYIILVVFQDFVSLVNVYHSMYRVIVLYTTRVIGKYAS